MFLCDTMGEVPLFYAASDIAFDALLDAAVDAIIIIDHRGTIERVNRATLQLFGYDEEELLGRNVKVLMPEPHRSRHDGYLENYLGGGEAGGGGSGNTRSGDTVGVAPGGSAPRRYR